MSIPTSLSQTKQRMKVSKEVAVEKMQVSTGRNTEEQSSGEEKVALTQALLDQLFPKIKARLKAENKNLELAILNQPLTLEGTEVPLEVMGHMQEDIALKLIPDLVQTIRGMGKVEKISFRIEIKEELEVTKERLYTNSEKLEFLKKKHGALTEFQRRFGLETDF